MIQPNVLRKPLVIALGLLATADVMAEANAPARTGSSILMEEVLVSARKRSGTESMQDVPVSISAYSGDHVEAMFATTLTDVGLTTPNASLTEIPTFPAVANFVIRGMGTVGQSIPSADPAVGVVIDGVALGTIYGAVTDLFDLESVEVLRGPQGTLFGRNATGGVVSLRSARPTEEFEGKVRATVGSHSQLDFAALISGPISDSLGGKIAVLSKDRKGYWDNENLGGEHGESETLLVRPAISYTSESFDTTLIAEYGEIKADGLGAIGWEVGGVQVLNPYDDRETNLDNPGFSDLEWESLVLESNWDLWEGRLTSIIGYRDLEQRSRSDVDGTSERLLEFSDGTFLEQDQLSLELRWSGDLTDNLTLTTGIYLFDQEYTYGERRILLDLLDRRGKSTIEHDTQGIFAQIDYNIVDSVTLTLGGRYTQEEKSADIGLIGDPNAVGDCASQTGGPFDATSDLNNCQAVLNDSEDWSNFSPKVGVNWFINEDIMGYASYTRGFRSGGYNVRFTDLTFVTSTPASSPGPYDEEVVDAIEVGAKSTLMDGKLRLNASLFYNDYDDLQRTTINSASTQEILNAASATIMGLELDATAAVTDNLVIQAGIGIIDAEYDEFDAGEIASGMDAEDINFVLAPDVTYNIAATYDFLIGDESSLALRMAYSYVDETYSNDSNTTKQRDYELVDASITYAHETSGLKVALYGKNIFDEVYYNFGTDFSGSALAHQSFWLTPPRTYGLEVTYEF